MEWFNINGFMKYMKDNFTAMDNHFTYDLLKNTIEYLMEQFEDNRYLVYTISEIIPDITEDEVLRFCAK